MRLGELFTDGEAAFYYRASNVPREEPFQLVALDERHIEKEFTEQTLPAVY